MDLTTHVDVRDLDRVYLDTIGGCDFYELRQIVKLDNGKQTVIGRASDWPIIAAHARNAELQLLLTASERRSVEADCHVAELIARIGVYQEHIAALEAALGEQAFTQRLAEPLTNGHAQLERAA